MFILRDYIKKGFLDAVGKMADYWIILNSSGYHDKGVLTEDDLAEIQMAIDSQYSQVNEVETEEVIENQSNVDNEETVKNTETEVIR